mmetsp:Transcript_60308/g.148003  ORF Transcript_60308/g.148003 Transcript_60308/m.148003 type:complete len:219 (+) Transcript_60308:134-790(+)
MICLSHSVNNNNSSNQGQRIIEKLRFLTQQTYGSVWSQKTTYDCSLPTNQILLADNLQEECGGRSNDGTGRHQDDRGRNHLRCTQLRVSWLVLCRGVRSSSRQLFHTDHDTLAHRFLCLTDPNTWVVELLVGLVRPVGVTDLSLKVRVLVLLEGTETVPVRPLGVSIDVHLDDAVHDGGTDLLVGRTGSTVHDQEDGFFQRRVQHLLGVGLVLTELFG